MANNNLMDRIRSFFGFRQEAPRNDFRNPIWGSDDEDDGDELYTRSNIDLYGDPMELHREITRQVQDMFRSFGSMFGDMGFFFEEVRPPGAIMDVPNEPENFNNNNIRDYYLKPGYQHDRHDLHKDNDLDGKLSSNDIKGLLKQKEDGQLVPVTPFDGNLVPGRAFCQTVITTSVTKPDGTVETRRIVKKGNEVVEETVTTTEPSRGPFSGLSPISTPGHVFSSLSSLLRNFY
ncbi:uncharacterized protein [Epargyreus clarus]|uniref:uncharacterized protein n=1 Tax=Epargyreus clarus TaxID=520877 RepID=UPI003C2B8759